MVINFGKALLIVVGVVLIGFGIVGAVYAPLLFQQNVQSLEKLRSLITK